MDGNVQPAQRIAYQASWQDCIVAISLGTISQALTAIESSPFCSSADHKGDAAADR
jgi:hypothetical protein